MLGGISIWQLLIILAIVIMIFGTKKHIIDHTCVKTSTR